MSQENAKELKLPKCNKATMKFIKAIGRHAKEDAFGVCELEMINYVFRYKKVDENPLVERVEIIEKSDYRRGLLIRKRNFIVGTDLEENIWELIDDYELNFKICDECGMPIDEGYYNEDVELYACCDECFKKQMNRTYGKDKWKKEVDTDTYYKAYDKEKDERSDVLAYYTEWY